MSRHLVMAYRTGRAEAEAEPVVIDTEDPTVVVLELDDGGKLELDPTELRAALDLPRAA
jgi:hypothetical protein